MLNICYLVYISPIYLTILLYKLDIVNIDFILFRLLHSI